MKTIRLAAAFLALSGAALAQSEGVAEFKGSMTGGAGQSIPSSGRVYLAKNAYRMEWEIDLKSVAAKEKDAPRGMVPSTYKTVMIQKASDQDHLITVNDARKVYAIADLKKLRETKISGPTTTYTVKKLGRDSVAGLSCEKALITSSSSLESELCVSTELIASSAWLSAMNRHDRGNTMMKALQDAGLNGFPIRWAIRSKGEQKPSSTMELVRFEKKSVPSSLFEVPVGYTQTSDDTVNLTAEQERKMKDAREKMKKQRGRQ